MKLRERIMETMVDLCNSDGASRITTNHVIDALDISPGTLYYHFKNKEEIIRAVFELIAAEFDTIYPDEGEAVTLYDFFDSVRKGFAIMHRYRFFYLDLPMLLGRDRELKKIYGENLARKTARQGALLGALVRSGIVRLPDSPEEIRCILDNIWIVNDFWMSFLLLSRDRISEKDVADGIVHYYYLVKPYLSDRARGEFDAVRGRLERPDEPSKKEE